MDNYSDAGHEDNRALEPLGTAQVAAPGQWDRDQKNIIKTVLAPGISDGELLLFGVICQRTGLDPFLKQIYAIMRNQRDEDGKWTKRMTVQTSIDGLRLLAARTREYAGSDDAEFGPEDDGHPTWARVSVWRFVQGQRCPFTHTVRWNEYVQRTRDGNTTGKWSDMPYNQLAKCAEAGALRKGFPAELSGIYVNEEMDQAANEPTGLPSPMPANVSPMPTPRRDQKPATPARHAEPTPIKKRSWQSLRRRALDIGVKSQEDWEVLVCDLTGKINQKDINGTTDYDLVEAYLADMELKQRVQDEDAASGGATVESEVVE